jgi:hypothetical protein
MNSQTHPVIQLVTIDELLHGHRLNIPTPITPYLTAPKNLPQADQLTLGGNVKSRETPWSPSQ